MDARRWLAALVLLVLAGCAVPTVEVADCDSLGRAFSADVSAEDRIAALAALTERFPDQRFDRFLSAARAAESGFRDAGTDAEALEAGLAEAVAMHRLADVAPVDASFADQVQRECPGVPAAVLRAGPDGLTPEPETTVGVDLGGVVDTFVAALAEAHRRTDGAGCAVLREGLAISAEAAAVPHLAASSTSGEVGCVFTDPTGPVLLVVVAVDGQVTERLTPLTDRPGRVTEVRDVFGMASARGYAAFDATSDGWLLVLTPGTPDPRVALDRLVASLG